MNWRKVKAEYIAGGISQRKLAEKYGIPWGTVRTKANEEKWTYARKRAEKKALQKAEQKIVEAVADNATLMERAKKALLMRVVDMAENYPGGNAAEVRKRIKGGLAIYRFKDIAAVLSVLEDKQQKGQGVDIEDLAPLAELLKDG